MDIHRCRFVPYPAPAINALAFSHPSMLREDGHTPSNLRLAIGRANGDIEIWNPLKGAWIQESILRGGKDRSIEGLVWTHDLEDETADGKQLPGKLRLFSTGYSTMITEWDLATGRPLRHSGGNYGEIWCLAAQPRWSSLGPSGKNAEVEPRVDQHLVVGCADGTLVVHSTADGDLKFLRILSRPSGRKPRVLCVTFLGRDMVVGGYADSTIRVYSIQNGRQVSSMSLGSGKKGGPSEILVWSIKCLPNGTIVSGDSTGEVRFWDSRTFTVLQRIKSHRVDILDLAVSADGHTVFSGGMDRRTTMYQQMGASGQGQRGRWAEISHQRYHEHDVKTMATFESSDMSVVASGGLDATPVIIPLREFGRENVRSLPMFPHVPPLQSAPSKRLILTWWDREINIWRIERSIQHKGDVENGIGSPQPRKLVAKIALKGEENIGSCVLAANGTMLAVATVSEVKLFRLRVSKMLFPHGLKVQKMEISHAPAGHGAKLVQFSPDSKWLLVIRTDDTVHLHRITKDTNTKTKSQITNRTVQLHRDKSRHHNLKLKHGNYGKYGKYEKSIFRVAWSSDSRILLVADLSGIMDHWILEGHEDLTQEHNEAVNGGKASKSSDGEDDEESETEGESEKHPAIIFGQHWIRNPATSALPRLPSPPLILSFRPSSPSTIQLTNGDTAIAVHPTRQNPHPHSRDLPHGEDRLLILTAEHQVFEYQVLKGKLSDWSRRNPSSSLPPPFKVNRDRARDCIWDLSGGRERVWLYGSSWLCMFDLSRDLAESDGNPEETKADKQIEVSSKKRKRDLTWMEKRALSKHTTGAGSKITNDELQLGIGNQVRRIDGPDRTNAKVYPFTPESVIRPTEDDNEDDDDNNDIESDDESGQASALVRLRRGEAVHPPQANGHNHHPKINNKSNNDSTDADKHGGESETNAEGPDAPAVEDDEGPHYWATYKYRPILGIVPLAREDVREGEDEAAADGDGGEDEGRAGVGVEVALVERPFWDLDLPPRYHGDQEWVK